MCAFRAGRSRGVSPQRAFTLIELLVVIAIIALLVSILMPSLSKAKLLAKRAACASNMRGLSLAAGMYRSEYDNKFPISIGGVEYNDHGNNTSGIRNYNPTWQFMLVRDGGAMISMLDCPAASASHRLPENIVDPRDARNLDEVLNHRLNHGGGSIGVMATIYAYRGGVYTGTWQSEMSGQDGAYHNSTGYPGDVAWRPETGWPNPQSKMYVADAIFSELQATYPSIERPWLTGGTNHIHMPDPGGDYLNANRGKRRFADRHVGTNVLMIHGGVITYKTQDLDAMTDRRDPGNIWTTGR